MKLLVTGSGTLLGNNVVVEALKQKHHVIASYRKSFPKNLKKKKVSLVHLDLEKKFNLNLKVDCLVHCASAIPSDNLKNQCTMRINYHGFIRLVSQLIKRGCKKIILISTMSVYGSVSVKKIDLNTKTKPIDSYGKSKLKIEKFLEKLKKKQKISFFILRLPALLGVNSDYNFISKVLKKVKRNEMVTYANPDLKFNNFIHVKNLAQIILKMIQLEDTKILNIACKRPMKLKSIIKKIYLHEKKVDTSKVIKSKSKGFSIKLDDYLTKNFHILSTKKTLELFLKENKAT